MKRTPASPSIWGGPTINSFVVSLDGGYQPSLVIARQSRELLWGVATTRLRGNFDWARNFDCRVT
eukprot:4591457-Prymnesium_polylepis.1